MKLPGRYRKGIYHCSHHRKREGKLSHPLPFLSPMGHF